MFAKVTINAICEIITTEQDKDNLSQIKTRNQNGCRLTSFNNVKQVHKQATAKLELLTIEKNGTFETVINPKSFETLARTVMRMVRRERQTTDDKIINLRYTATIYESRFKKQVDNLLNEIAKKITK